MTLSKTGTTIDKDSDGNCGLYVTASGPRESMPP